MVPAQSLATARMYHTATALPSARVPVTAGRRPSGTIATASAVEYDPPTGTWTDAGDRIFVDGLQPPVS